MINNQYTIKKKIGEGRSQVFLCCDKNFPGKDFAIKIFGNTENLNELEIFRKEFFTIRKLNHPNIIKAYEYGTVLNIDDEIKSYGIKELDKFFVLDYFPGVNLLEFHQIQNEKILKDVLIKICLVLYYLHQSNYIYHDLKPENILIKESDGETDIMFVDFGLTRFLPEDNTTAVRGTPNYIAPEILRMDRYDHRVDLYSLGILLYRTIYGKFPFETEKEVEIYKAHMEKKFEFPAVDFSKELLGIVSRLLSKKPGDRYYTSLNILTELKEPIRKKYKLNWTTSKTFCDRKEVITNIKTYLANKELQEAIVIRGKEGAGKTFLLEEIAATENTAILIQNNLENRQDFWKTLLQKILFLDSIYGNIDYATKQNILNLVEKESNKLVEDIKSLLMEVSHNNKFILLLDDFNSYDDFTIELLKEIIPILQVNSVKVIITEDTANSISSKFISNLRIYTLTSFSEHNLQEFLHKSFFSLFPREEIYELIKSYTDLLPGSIVRLINDLIFLSVLDFTYSGPFIKESVGVNKLLKESQNEIYKLQLMDLSKDEKRVTEILSLFEVSLDEKTISTLLDIPKKEIAEIIENLRNNNILYPANASLNPRFTTQNFAKYIYSNLSSKKEYHKFVAEKIKVSFKNFNKSELARQFELAEQYVECYNVGKELIAEAENRSAIQYKRKILELQLKLPLDQSRIKDIKLELCDTLYRLGEFKLCSNLIKELLLENIDAAEKNELLIQQGICLINLGELMNGRELLNSLLKGITDELRKQFIHTQIANAELYLNNYWSTEITCKEIVGNEKSSDETKGLAYNLLGLVELYQNNNLDGTIKNFEKSLQMFVNSQLPSRIAGAELNLGNIYVMKGDLTEAEKHWQNSLRINKFIGNLDHEAKLLLNYGIFYFDNQDFEKSIEQYQRAENIFTSLGNKYGRGLSLLNLGESYLRICEYQNSMDSLNEAKTIFQRLNNKEEEAEVLFLLGQFYYHVGDKRQLNALVEKFQKFIDKYDLIQKNKNNLNFLVHLRSLLNEKYSEIVREIDTVLNYYRMQNDRENNYYFAKGILVYSMALIKQNKYETALEKLNDKYFSKLCSRNLLFQAEKYYLLGIISWQIKNHNLELPIDYFNKAYNIIEKQSITELSWTVNFSLAEFYFDRGNVNKAKNFVKMAESILNHITSKITNDQIRTSYLKETKRKNAIETLEHYKKQF